MTRFGLAALAAGALVFVMTATAAERQGEFAWAGKWNTNWGVLDLKGSGGSVTGTYPHQGGQVTGSASGNVLKGTWTEEPTRKAPIDAGPFEFVMKTTATSVTFEGTWKTFQGLHGGAWNGDCFQGACLTNKGRPTPGSTTPTTTTPDEPSGINGNAVQNALRTHGRLAIRMDESQLTKLMQRCKSLYPPGGYVSARPTAADERRYWNEVAKSSADAKTALKGLKKLLSTAKDWQGDAQTPKASAAVKEVRAALEKEIDKAEKTVAALSKMLAEYQYFRKNPKLELGPCLLTVDIIAAVGGLRRAQEAVAAKLVRLARL